MKQFNVLLSSTLNSSADFNELIQQAFFINLISSFKSQSLLFLILNSLTMIISLHLHTFSHFHTLLYHAFSSLSDSLSSSSIYNS